MNRTNDVPKGRVKATKGMTNDIPKRNKPICPKPRLYNDTITPRPKGSKGVMNNVY